MSSSPKRASSSSPPTARIRISPDGWDRSQLQSSLLEPITLATYLRRINASETRAKVEGERPAGIPTDNTTWMREALDPSWRDGERPMPEKEADVPDLTEGEHKQTKLAQKPIHDTTLRYGGRE